MSQRAVEQVLGKMLTDESFRESFLADPERATLRAGLCLAPHEIEALRGVPREILAEVATRLDGRIRRLCVERRPAPTETTR